MSKRGTCALNYEWDFRVTILHTYPYRAQGIILETKTYQIRNSDKKLGPLTSLS